MFDQLWHRYLRRPYGLHVAIDEGKGKTVVLLHGIASYGGIWSQLAQRLTAHNRRVIAYDLIGFGESPKPYWLQYRVDDHAREVLASLKRDNVTDKITLVGHSMGCLVAIHLAYLRPELFERLVLYEPPLYADAPQFNTHAKRRKFYFGVYERVASSPSMVLTYAKLLGRLAAKVAGIGLSEEQWLPFERSLRNTIMGQQTYQELLQLRVLTKVVHGRFDMVITHAEIRDMFKTNRHVTFYRVTDIHGVTRKSSAYLAGLILPKPHTKHPQKQGKRRVASLKRKRHTESMQKAKD